jgi:hypothetical protein
MNSKEKLKEKIIKIYIIIMYVLLLIIYISLFSNAIDQFNENGLIIGIYTGMTIIALSVLDTLSEKATLSAYVFSGIYMIIITVSILFIFYTTFFIKVDLFGSSILYIKLFGYAVSAISLVLKSKDIIRKIKEN